MAGQRETARGEQVWDVTGDLYCQEIDVLVEVTFNRRPYRGTRSTDTRTFRVVGHRNEATGTYHCYITNLSHERFSPDQVVALYRARWEVELLFRELKSWYELDAIRTSKAAIVEVLVLVSILTLVVSWVVLGVLRDEAEKRGEDPTFPRELWAITFESFAPLIADRLARNLG